MTNENTIPVRKAIEDRGAWLFFLFREMAKEFGRKKAEEISRIAIREFGKAKAVKEKSSTPKEWVKKHVEKGSKEIFESKSEHSDENNVELEFHYCPLLERWKELGANQEEQDLLCDIAMEGDRAKAEALGFKVEITRRMGKGDKICKVLIKK